MKAVVITFYFLSMFATAFAGTCVGFYQDSPATIKAGLHETEISAWRTFSWTNPSHHNDNSFNYRVYSVNTAYTNTKPPYETFNYFTSVN